jgi:hypothetical protein
MLNSIRLREEQLGKPVAEAYDKTLYILCGLLAIGFVANLLMPVCNRLYPIQRTPVERPVAEVRAADGGTPCSGQGRGGDSIMMIMTLIILLS